MQSRWLMYFALSLRMYICLLQQVQIQEHVTRQIFAHACFSSTIIHTYETTVQTNRCGFCRSDGKRMHVCMYVCNSRHTWHIYICMLEYTHAFLLPANSNRSLCRRLEGLWGRRPGKRTWSLNHNASAQMKLRVRCLKFGAVCVRGLRAGHHTDGSSIATSD